MFKPTFKIILKPNKISLKIQQNNRTFRKFGGAQKIWKNKKSNQTGYSKKSGVLGNSAKN